MNANGMAVLRWVAVLLTAGLTGTAGAADTPAEAPYSAWRHTASLWILTTPEGADLPAACDERDFPLLVRLDRETFDFAQAAPGGQDVRFSTAAGAPLACQVEHWDASAGAAAIWVRIPRITGNARQEIRMHWGKADAPSRSDGAAVFNRSNGFAAVLHMGGKDGVKDEVGTLSPVDQGTSPCLGMVGPARRFEPGKGVACGEKIAGLPAGFDAHTTGVWFRAENVNTTAVAWGNEQAQGKVVMLIQSPPHVRMDCYFSGANVAGQSRLPMSEWVHVVHACRKGDSRVYVNGQLDGASTGTHSPLNIRTPARMWIGGWYNQYRFAGEIDEVRISTVARSADWVKLEYENQRRVQTLLGTPVQPGSEFSVSHRQVVLDEGRSVAVSARAGGAQKVYWLLQQDGAERRVAADRFAFTLDAGRVAGDRSAVLRFKAVYPDTVKSLDIPVTIRDTIPEPKLTLQAPKEWNGRDTIEVVPAVSNLAAMKAAGAGELTTHWTVTGGAVIKQVAPDRLILRRSQYSGPITVAAAVDNGGQPSVATADIRVSEPATDPWLARTPEDDEKAEEGQFYARDDNNEGTLHYNGRLEGASAGQAVFLRVYADDKLYKAQERPLGPDKRYAFAVKLQPGLVKYRAEFGVKAGGQERVLERVGDLVCGDAYLIHGQSNALATDTREESPRESHEWVRSYGGPAGRSDGVTWVRQRLEEARRAGLARPNLWCRPVWKAKPEHQAELGWWGMELAKRLVASRKVPIFVLTAAVGGTRIDEHLPSPADRSDLKTIYGRTLWRVRQARMTHGLRAVIWHQGESDQGADGPTGLYGWQTYRQFFVDLSAAWKEDFPNTRRYYVFQIWPDACSMGGKQGSGDRLREAQRTLPRLFSNMEILSTLGIKPPGPCHYPLAGWTQFAVMLQPLIERDFYGRPPAGSITPPNLLRARYTTAARDAIALEFDQPVAWNEAATDQFYLDDKAGEVASGSAAGSAITLKLKAPSSAAKITYLKERQWSQTRLIFGANGIAALTFCDVAIEGCNR